MRIKWTSIHSVTAGNSAVPWVAPGFGERLKQEALNEREPEKKEKKKKTERVLAWFRRSR